MKSSKKFVKYNIYEILLLISFILILNKGLEYTIIGLYYPLLLSIVFLLPFGYIFLNQKKTLKKIIKYWSILIICYSVIRIFLNALILIEPGGGIPSGAYYQFTIGYGLKSISYLILGILLFIKRKLIFPILNKKPHNI